MAQPIRLRTLLNSFSNRNAGHEAWQSLPQDQKRAHGSWFPQVARHRESDASSYEMKREKIMGTWHSNRLSSWGWMRGFIVATVVRAPLPGVGAENV